MNAMLLQAGSAPSLLEQVSAIRVVQAILILILAWLAIRWSARLLEFLSQRSPRARFFFKRLEPVIRIVLWFAAVVASFNLLAPSRETFWAAIGAMGLALGLGAQDLIKNVIGGLVVLTDRPYQLGDRVKIGDAYGEIDHIGLRSTKLTTPDDTRVTIPNSDILSGKAYNANSGALDCQVVTDLYLPPDADPVEAVRIGYEAAYSSPYLLSKKPVVVLLIDKYTETPYVTVRVKAYVYDHRFEPRMQSDITQRAKTQYIRRGMLGSWQSPPSAELAPRPAIGGSEPTRT